MKSIGLVNGAREVITAKIVGNLSREAIMIMRWNGAVIQEKNKVMVFSVHWAVSIRKGKVGLVVTWTD